MWRALLQTTDRLLEVTLRCDDDGAFVMEESASNKWSGETTTRHLYHILDRKIALVTYERYIDMCVRGEWELAAGEPRGTIASR